MAPGNGGATNNTAFQILAADAGMTHRFSVDAGSPDQWWKPNGEVKMEFLDSSGTMISEALTHWTTPDFDVVFPWQNFSVTETAPAGTAEIRATQSNQGPDGGTMRFDNASLDVVPEPATTGLVALGALALFGRRTRRS